MKDDKIIVYTEGSLTLGLGNVYRSIALSDALSLCKDIDFEFVTSSQEYVRSIISSKYIVTFKVDRLSVLEYIVQKKPKIVIIDYLNIESSFVQLLKENNICTVIIGNDSDANCYANLVVNAIIGTNFENSNTVDHFGTRYLKGPRYLVLRKEFEDKRDSYHYNGNLRNLTLMFGGTDQANFSLKILKKIIEESHFEGNIKIILGAGYPFKTELSNYIINKGVNNRVTILQNITNVSTELLTSDFLITSPGTSLFEAFALGIPSLAFFQNDSQEKIFNSFYNAMKYNSSLDLMELVFSIYKNLDSFRHNLNKLSVGTGRHEIIDNIINL